MAKLTDTQIIVLTAAVQRPGNVVLPLPERLRGGAAQKVVKKLIDEGLIAEIPLADLPDAPVWREDGDGPVTLVATEAAADALGLSGPEAGVEPARAAVGATRAKGSKTAAKSKGTAGAAEKLAPPRVRAGTKQARLIAMLEASDGATVAEIAAALDWQPHTVRGAIAGALKKKLGLTVTTEKVEGRGGVYRIVR